MSLTEVIVGIGLLATAIIGLNALVLTMIRGNVTAQLADQATRLAGSKLAELRSAGYDKVPIGKSADTWWSVSAGRGVRFDRATTVVAGPLPDTRSITVTVSWKDRAQRVETFTTELVK